MPNLNLISVPQLSKLIGTPSLPTLIDCCMDADFSQDPVLIPTAQRIPHDSLAERAPEFAGKKIVVICQKGQKLSQGAAALLRAKGMQAEALEGGMYAWLAAGRPAILASALPVPPSGSLWVTRHRPKIDRIACPWLIRRFIDPAAQFLFVAPSEVLDVAERFGATPFDTDGAALSDHNSACCFDAMLVAFHLDTRPLQVLANLVRAADLGRLEDVPEAAGLLAFSVGLSRMHKDDLAQVEAGIAFYDALYRWARDGQDETHGHAT